MNIDDGQKEGKDEWGLGKKIRTEIVAITSLPFTYATPPPVRTDVIIAWQCARNVQTSPHVMLSALSDQR